MNDNTEVTEKVTGKKILTDCVVLARDIGVFLFDLGKRAYFAVKNAITSDDEKSKAADSVNAENSAAA